MLNYNLFISVGHQALFGSQRPGKWQVIKFLLTLRGKWMRHRLPYILLMDRKEDLEKATFYALLHNPILFNIYSANQSQLS